MRSKNSPLFSVNYFKVLYFILIRELHEVFKRFKVKGEWFESDKIIFDYIEEFEK